MTNSPSWRFIKTSIVIVALGILFIAWQLNVNPEGWFMHYLFGISLMLLGIVINGFCAILEAIENSKKTDEEKDENKKEILKG
ncbi:MAG: hypothetical protein AABY15_07145 [Nanoarchaeota archaeon]